MNIYQNFVGGEWVNSISGKTFEERNPANLDDVIGCFQASQREDVDKAIVEAQNAKRNGSNVLLLKELKY